MQKNDSKYNDKEYSILQEVSEFCLYECSNKLNCLEEKCILFRIEKIITKQIKGA